MSYCIACDDRDIQAAVRRIAAEQIDRALADLADTGRPLARRVHEARKAVKKIRGLIRLVRPGFADYAEENAALRDAGMTIRALRDAEVMLATFDRLAASAKLSPEAAAELRAPFEARKAEAEQPGALEAAIADFSARMLEVRARSEGWRVRGKRFDTPAAGLEATLRKGREAMRTALDDPTEEAVHSWRKRVKDHWYQMRLLEPLWPEMLAVRTATADALGELLGDYNDLSVLGHHLPAAAVAGPLRDAAARRQAKLLARARPLSRRLLAVPPSALAEELAVLWSEWHGA